jgi:hypothetical protein
MHSVPHLANGAFYAGLEHPGNTRRSLKLITGSRSPRIGASNLRIINVAIQY